MCSLSKADHDSVSVRKPKRVVLRFGLRTLLLTLLAVGIWVGFKSNHARKQKDAVDAIQSLGGSVVYYYQQIAPVSAGGGFTTAKPPGPTWLRRILGDEYFVKVYSANLGGRDVCDQHLELLKAMPTIKRVFLLPDDAGELHVIHHIFCDSKAAWDEIGDAGRRHREAFSA